VEKVDKRRFAGLRSNIDHDHYYVHSHHGQNDV
jgi:hypothetical protein